MDKNKSTMPPLPGHPEPFAMAWTELELREIEEYGMACWNAAITAALEKIPSSLAASQQPAAAPAEQAQGQAAERNHSPTTKLLHFMRNSGYITGERMEKLISLSDEFYSTNPPAAQQGDGELPRNFYTWASENVPQFFSGSPPTWEIVEANVRIHARNAWNAALAQRAGSAKPAEQAEAPNKPAVTVDDDDGKFQALLSDDLPRHRRAEIIAHIDAHTARAVAEALEGQLTEMGPGGALYQPQDIFIEGRTSSGHTIDLEIFGDGTKNGKQLFIVALPATPQPAGAVQEPIGIIKEGNFSNRFEWVSDEVATNSLLIGLNVYASAPPAAVQPDVPRNLTASCACPVCDIDTPHRHSDLEIYRWLETQASRFLPGGVKVIPKSDYEQPALICQGQPQGHHGRYHVASQVNLWVPEGTKLYLHPVQQPDSERDAARAGINPVFVLPVSVAVLIDQAFLPSNPNKLRAAREDVKDAAKIYKSSLAAMLARLAAQQGEKGGA